LRLPCFVDNLDGFVLLWRKNNTIIAVGEQVIDSVSLSGLVKRK
jgi:hypothetical protein